MKQRMIVILFSPMLFAGCGGSSDGPSVVSPPPQGNQQVISNTATGEIHVSYDGSPVRVFSDQSGVANLTASGGGESATGFLVGPDIALAIDELENLEEVEPVDTGGLATVGSGPNTIFQEGAITDDGVALNVLTITTVDEDATVILLEEPTFGDRILFVLGDIESNVPFSGTATYSGVLGIDDLAFTDEPEFGTFAATVNFGGQPTVQLEGDTDNFAVSGTAVVTDDTFSATDLLIFDAFEGVTVSGRLNGNFHGESANSMAGVIYSNDSFGRYRGAFIGSQ